MAALDLSLSAVSVPSNASCDVIVYEDVGDDGGASTDTADDGTTIDYDNKDTVSLSDGTTSYTTANTFDESSGNSYQLRFLPDNSDVEQTAEITGPVDLTVESSLTISTPVSSASGTTPAPSVTGSGAVSVNPPVASATGTTPTPDDILTAQLINAPTATASGTTPTPGADGTGTASVSTPATTATGATPAPTVSPAGSTISAPTATATGSTPSPSVSATTAATISTPAAVGTATAPAPTATLPIAAGSRWDSSGSGVIETTADGVIKTL